MLQPLNPAMFILICRASAAIFALPGHGHPGGWISSCYYVDLPDAVKDEAGQQGWIKFGEPSFDVGLTVRRAIQPAVGRLVLFPSYLWHGTVPFHDRHPRTTIAFDVLPS